MLERYVVFCILCCVGNLLYRKCGVEVRDFGSCWRDGVAFNALIHGLQPELVDMSVLAQNSSQANLEHAFTTAEEHLGIPRLLDVEGKKPDDALFLTLMMLVILFVVHKLKILSFVTHLWLFVSCNISLNVFCTVLLNEKYSLYYRVIFLSNYQQICFLPGADPGFAKGVCQEAQGGPGAKKYSVSLKDKAPVGCLGVQVPYNLVIFCKSYYSDVLGWFDGIAHWAYD